MIYLASHTFPEIIPSWYGEFSLKSIFLSMSKSNKSFPHCLSHLLHQGVLMEVSEMAHGKVELAYVQLLGPIGCVLLAGVMVNNRHGGAAGT